MPRLSRPTLKPNASSACVTAFSEERDWAHVWPALHTATVATLNLARLRHDRICRTPCYWEFERVLIICTRGSLKWRRDEIPRRLRLGRSQVTRHSARRRRRSIDLRTVAREIHPCRSAFPAGLAAGAPDRQSPCRAPADP